MGVTPTAGTGKKCVRQNLSLSIEGEIVTVLVCVKVDEDVGPVTVDFRKCQPGMFRPYLEGFCKDVSNLVAV